MNPFPFTVLPRLLIKCATWSINVWFVQILRSVSESETWFMLNTGKNQNFITLRSSGFNSRPNSTAYCPLRSKINPNEMNCFKWFSKCSYVGDNSNSNSIFSSSPARRPWCSNSLLQFSAPYWTCNRAHVRTRLGLTRVKMSVSAFNEINKWVVKLFDF